MSLDNMTQLFSLMQKLLTSRKQHPDGNGGEKKHRNKRWSLPAGSLAQAGCLGSGNRMVPVDYESVRQDPAKRGAGGRCFHHSVHLPLEAANHVLSGGRAGEVITSRSANCSITRHEQHTRNVAVRHTQHPQSLPTVPAAAGAGSSAAVYLGAVAAPPPGKPSPWQQERGVAWSGRRDRCPVASCSHQCFQVQRSVVSELPFCEWRVRLNGVAPLSISALLLISKMATIWF